jgi:hypothetical protein
MPAHVLWGGWAWARRRPPALSLAALAYDRTQGLPDNTRLKSFVRWIGVKPGPG